MTTRLLPETCPNRHMNRMKGQLRFDEFMDISEEKPRQKTSGCAMYRTPMVDPCYYCLCNSCINNAESTTVNPDEIPCVWEPCFFCDDCRVYDGDPAKKRLEREQCSRYRIDCYHAGQKRRKFKIVREREKCKD